MSDPIADLDRVDIIVARAEIFDTPNQAVIATTVAGTIVFWSRAAERIYGWPAEEVMGRDIVDVTPSRISQQMARDLMQQLRKGRSWTGEFPVQRRDGFEFTALVRDLPVVAESGELVGIVGISTPAPLRS